MKVAAYCKVNLYLKVLDQRPDGYHELVTVFQTVSLFDTLEFFYESDGEDLSLSLAPTSSIKVPVDNTNLVIKSLKFLKRYADRDVKSVKIRLDKQIPVGAGLGGGSADAAAALVAVDRLCSLNCGDAALGQIAENVGADVPFFLKGGTALGRGRGELLTPLKNTAVYSVVIVYPGFSVHTGKAYGWVDEARQGSPKDDFPLQDMVSALERGNIADLCSSMHNDFHDVVAQHHPEIACIRDRLLNSGCESAQLTGSGSAVFGICSSRETAESVRDELARHYPHVYCAEPTTRGIDIMPG
jgi:4-diphosphocytidyl-2-C-methyl-D-erythritol kinase